MTDITQVQAVKTIVVKIDGPPGQVAESATLTSGPTHPEPVSHLESAGLTLFTATRESQELDALRILLPRYLHDLKNVVARLVIQTDHIVGDFEGTNLPPALKEFSEYSSLLVDNRSDNSFSRWEEFVAQDVQDSIPGEILEEAKRKGKVLEEELKSKIGPLIEFTDTYKTSDQDTLALLAKIKSSGVEILESINNLNTAESYLDYRGKAKTFNPFDFLCNFFHCPELTPAGKVLKINKPTLQGDPCLISIDPTLFICSAENLTRNAAKAALKAGIPLQGVEFRITVVNEGGKVQIILEDTGPGMPEEYLRKIRTGEEFSGSLGESKGKGGGANQGFGVQNVIRNIDLAGGTVTVDSSQDGDNHFTRFVLQFPAVTVPNPVESSGGLQPHGDETLAVRHACNVDEVAPVQDASETSPTETILIVRKYGPEAIAGILRQGRESEYRIITAKTFEEALMLAEQHKPKLIISEFKPPGSEQTACAMLDQIAISQGKLPKVILVRTGSDLQLEGVRVFKDDPDVIDLDEAVKDILSNNTEK